MENFPGKSTPRTFGNNSKKALFGIVQGGIYKDLRLESLENLKKILSII